MIIKAKEVIGMNGSEESWYRFRQEELEKSLLSGSKQTRSHTKDNSRKDQTKNG